MPLLHVAYFHAAPDPSSHPSASTTATALAIRKASAFPAPRCSPETPPESMTVPYSPEHSTSSFLTSLRTIAAWAKQHREEAEDAEVDARDRLAGCDTGELFVSPCPPRRT